MSAASTESVLSEVRAHYAERWGSFADSLPRDEPDWLAELRSAAIERFGELGFPTTRDEDWRYTNIASLARRPLEMHTPRAAARAGLEACAERSRFAGLAADLYVFVNGRFDAELSDASSDSFASLLQLRGDDPSRLEARLGSCTSSDDSFAALNTAFLEDGAVIHARSDESSERAVHLLFIATGDCISHPRVLVIAETGSQICVIQDHVSLGNAESVTNAVTEVVAGANSSVDVVLLQRENDQGQLFTSTWARQDRSSRFAEHTVTLGGGLVRNELSVGLHGEGAECSLRGLFIGKNSRHIDNHTSVDHAVPHCSSNELYKGILDDQSRGVFRGRVVVQKDAQKSNAVQSNPNLLLADSAEIDTKPQLEIYADDIRCSHGSAIGHLDAEALFYLRARGIGERDARELLTQGFAHEITSALPGRALAEGVRALLFANLESTTGVQP